MGTLPTSSQYRELEVGASGAVGVRYNPAQGVEPTWSVKGHIGIGYMAQSNADFSLEGVKLEPENESAGASAGG